MINLMLADNRPLDTALIKEFEQHNIQLKQHCKTSYDVIDNVKEEQPDVIMISLTLGGLGAFETIDHLKMNFPRIGIVILLVHSDGPFPKKLLDTGVGGYISRKTSPEDVVESIEVVHSGEKYISPEIAQKIAISLLPGAETSPLDRLSEREMQVMLQLSQGDTPLQISTRLALSPKTVSTYKHRVRDKLRVDDTQEIYALAGSHGLVEL